MDAGVSGFEAGVSGFDAGVSGLEGGVSGVEGGVVGVEGVDGELGAGSSLLLEELSSSLSEDSLDESSDFAGVGEGLGLGLGLGDGEGDGEGAGAGSFFFFFFFFFFFVTVPHLQQSVEDEDDGSEVGSLDAADSPRYDPA